MILGFKNASADAGQMNADEKPGGTNVWTT
jgi:hypothetical protein